MIYTPPTLRVILLEQVRKWNGYIRKTKKRRLHRCNIIIQARRRAITALNRKKKRANAVVDPQVDYQSTQWGQLIKKLSLMNEGRGPCITQREGKLFRRRFRVSWQIYCELILKCKEFNLFGPMSNEDVTIGNKEICPITIKMLGVLRMLGRNWICDDVAEATGMGESTVRTAFKLFCENFVDSFYDKYIYRPVGDQLKNIMSIYTRMGLPGCVGSTDCVHVKWDRCPIELTNLCKGKEGYPTLVYSCVVDHSRRILSVTPSNFGTRNDKTIVRLDSYIMAIKEGLVNSDISFDIWKSENIVISETGVWLLCDGGYHKWLCMMNPMKHTASRVQRLWSEWVESVRKDVECVFGILKSRFRILKQGFLFQTQAMIDTVFFTCAILHNMLLEHDGLANRWDEDVAWDMLNPQAGVGDDGYDIDGLGSTCQTRCQQEQRILSRVQRWESATGIEYEGNEVVEEVELLFEDKRQMLCNHFQIAYGKGEVSWPRGFINNNHQ